MDQPLQDISDHPHQLFTLEKGRTFAAMKTQKAPNVATDAQLRMNERKWSKAVMAAGYTVVPYVLLDRQDEFKLTPVELNVLMQLANYWWQAENLPHPSKASLAKRMGASPKTVQRAIRRLQAAGLINRKYRYHSTTRGQLTNVYEFDGLIAALKPLAKQELERREQRRKEEATRSRKKALRLVKNEETE